MLRLSCHRNSWQTRPVGFHFMANLKYLPCIQSNAVYFWEWFTQPWQMETDRWSTKSKRPRWPPQLQVAPSRQLDYPRIGPPVKSDPFICEKQLHLVYKINKQPSILTWKLAQESQRTALKPTFEFIDSAKKSWKCFSIILRFHRGWIFKLSQKNKRLW